MPIISTGCGLLGNGIPPLPPVVIPEVSREFTKATQNYIWRANPSITVPGVVTMACWTYLPTITVEAGAHTAIAICNSTVNNPLVRIARNSGTSQQMVALSRDNANGIDSVISTAGTVTDANRWYHVALVLRADKKLALYMDGVEKLTTGTVDGTITLDRLLIGATPWSGLAQYGTSKVYWAAVWNTELTAEQIGQLNSGSNPNTIATANLVSFPNLYTLRDIDGVTWTDVNSVISEDIPTFGEGLLFEGDEESNNLMVGGIELDEQEYTDNQVLGLE